MAWPFGRMRVAPARQKRLHQQATIVAANAAMGADVIISQAVRWTGTALADVYPGFVGISRLKRAVQP